MAFDQLRLRLWMNALRRKGKVLTFARPVSVQEQLAGMKKVCICMPPDHKYFYEARACLQEIRKPQTEILLVLSHDLELLAEHHGKTEIYPQTLKKPFPLREDQVANIPKRFDVALDLSPEPTPMTAYITGTRGKKLTLGFSSGTLDPFYTALVEKGEDYRASVMTLLALGGLI